MAIPSALVKSVLKVARGAESYHGTTALKSAIRSSVESITDGYGSAANLVQGLTEYGAYGGKIPSKKTIGTQPSSKGTSFMLDVDDAAERLSWGVNAASDYPRVPKGTITNRAGTGAMRARVKKLAQTQETAAKSIPPFKGGTRFTGGDPRAMVTGAARREELSMKSKVAGKRSKAKKPVKSRVMGPDTQEQSKVDDLFGVKW